MACSCGLVGSLIFDVGSGGERRSNPQRRKGIASLFSIKVTDKQGTAALSVEIWHWNDSETTKTLAGSFSAISTTGLFTKSITGLKQNYLWLYKIDAAGDPDRYVVDSPTEQPLQQ